MDEYLSPKEKGVGCSRLGCGIALLVIIFIFWLIALSDGSIGSGTAFFLSICTIIGMLLVLFRKKDKSKRVESRFSQEQIKADMDKMLTELREGNISILKVEGIKSDAILGTNEKIIFMLPGIALSTFISIDEVKGDSGISIMGWGYSGGVRSEHTEERRVIDGGTLLITNTRLIFDGERRSSETLLSDILSIKKYTDGVGVKSRARELVQYYILQNPKIFTMTLQREERSHSIEMTGEWLSAIIEGAIRNKEKPLQSDNVE